MRNHIQESTRVFLKLAGLSLTLAAIAIAVLASQAWSFSTNPNHPATEQLAAGKEVVQVFTSGTNTWVYMCYLPYAYDSQPTKKWPMIIFQPCMSGTDGSWGALQGGNNCSGLSGYLYAKDTVHTIYSYQLRAIADSFIVVTPWQSTQFNTCHTNIDALYREYYPTFFSHVYSTVRADTMRIHVMGECWGASVAYKWASLYPNVPASMSLWEINDPTNGCCDTTTACLLKNIPMRFIHSDKDPYNPWQNAKLVADAITHCGNTNVTWYLEANAPHETWMYSAHSDKDTALYRWMLAQKKTNSTSVSPRLNDVTGIGFGMGISGNGRFEVIDLQGQVVMNVDKSELRRLLPRTSQGVYLIRAVDGHQPATRASAQAFAR
jgi:predicted peptidase